MPERCVCCGEIIPEGRQYCPNCLVTSYPPDMILPDGTRLYLKTTDPAGSYPYQLDLYRHLGIMKEE